jgi:hypothetical protein
MTRAAVSSPSSRSAARWRRSRARSSSSGARQQGGGGRPRGRRGEPWAVQPAADRRQGQPAASAWRHLWGRQSWARQLHSLCFPPPSIPLPSPPASFVPNALASAGPSAGPKSGYVWCSAAATATAAAVSAARGGGASASAETASDTYWGRGVGEARGGARGVSRGLAHCTAPRRCCPMRHTSTHLLLLLSIQPPSPPPTPTPHTLLRLVRASSASTCARASSVTPRSRLVSAAFFFMELSRRDSSASPAVKEGAQGGGGGSGGGRGVYAGRARVHGRRRGPAAGAGGAGGGAARGVRGGGARARAAAAGCRARARAPGRAGLAFASAAARCAASCWASASSAAAAACGEGGRAEGVRGSDPEPLPGACGGRRRGSGGGSGGGAARAPTARPRPPPHRRPTACPRPQHHWEHPAPSCCRYRCREGRDAIPIGAPEIRRSERGVWEAEMERGEELRMGWCTAPLPPCDPGGRGRGARARRYAQPPPLTPPLRRPMRRPTPKGRLFGIGFTGAPRRAHAGAPAARLMAPARPATS